MALLAARTPRCHRRGRIVGHWCCPAGGTARGPRSVHGFGLFENFIRGFCIPDFGFRAAGFGFRVPSFGICVPDFIIAQLVRGRFILPHAFVWIVSILGDLITWAM